MKAKTILEYLDTQRINELREILIGEICKKKNRKRPTYKAIQKLSIKAEKDLRIPRSQNKVTFKWNYIKPNMAGAYFKNGKTMITNGIYGAIFNKEIEGLKMVDGNWEYFDIENIIPNHENWEEVKINKEDINKKTIEDKDYKNVKINNTNYDIKTLFMLLDCFEKPKIYNNSNSNQDPLVIKGDNGIGILICYERSIY